MGYVARLREPDLWRQFHSHQNEMIITKAGRCLFPLLRVDFVPSDATPGSCGSPPLVDLNLEDDHQYRVQLEFSSPDAHKWKWRETRWIPLLTSHTLLAGGEFHHHFPSARTITIADALPGSQIISEGLDFERVKLTNRPEEGPFSVTLQSFHRYLPIIHLVSLEGGGDSPSQTIKFPETEFIAVTHYQNEQITLLKKSYNPHAKGFVISDEVPTLFGALEWPPPSSAGKRRRVRRRIVPIASSPKPSSDDVTMPSDEEELQGSLALQFLSSSSQAQID